MKILFMIKALVLGTELSVSSWIWVDISAKCITSRRKVTPKSLLLCALEVGF